MATKCTQCGRSRDGLMSGHDWPVLVRAVAEAQDRTAFTTLFDYFAPRVKSFIIHMGADDETAEEIAQETLLTLWRKADLFDPSKSSLSTWLFRVARNRRIDQIRRAQTGMIDKDDPTLIPDAEPPADAMLDSVVREMKVREALLTLPEEQKVLVELAFFRGLSHSQIAAETALPLGTVKSRIRLAFDRLRKAFDADDEMDTDFKS